MNWNHIMVCLRRLEAAVLAALSVTLEGCLVSGMQLSAGDAVFKQADTFVSMVLGFVKTCV